jgi:hypothetical protein
VTDLSITDITSHFESKAMAMNLVSWSSAGRVEHDLHASDTSTARELNSEEEQIIK